MIAASEREGENELALDSDDSLPWLESDEYDPEEGNVDTSRIVALAGFLLLLLVAGIGGVWWYSNSLVGDEIIADGSSFATIKDAYVGEGVTSETQLAEAESSAPVAAPDAAPRPMITTSMDGEGAQESGVAVQVGAYGSRAKAEAGWVTLRGQTTLLNGVRYRVVKGQADIGTVYRLQALPGDLAAARTLCAGLKEDGVACNVKQ